MVNDDDDLRLAARGQAVVAGRVLEDRASMSSSLLSGARPSFVLARGRVAALATALRRSLAFSPKRFSTGAGGTSTAPTVAVRDGVEDGLEPVLQLARKACRRARPDRLRCRRRRRRGRSAPSARRSPLQKPIFWSEWHGGAMEPSARGGEHLLVGLGDVADAVATAELAQTPAVVPLDHQLGDLVEPEALCAAKKRTMSKMATLRSSAPWSQRLDGAAHLDRVFPVVLALGRSLRLRGAGRGHAADDGSETRGGDGSVKPGSTSRRARSAASSTRSNRRAARSRGAGGRPCCRPCG